MEIIGYILLGVILFFGVAMPFFQVCYKFIKELIEDSKINYL